MGFNGWYQDTRKAGISGDPDVWVAAVPMFGCNSSPVPIVFLLSTDRFSPALPKHPRQRRGRRSLAQVWVNNAEHDLFTVWKWVILRMIHLVVFVVPQSSHRGILAVVFYCCRQQGNFLFSPVPRQMWEVGKEAQRKKENFSFLLGILQFWTWLESSMCPVGASTPLAQSLKWVGCSGGWTWPRFQPLQPFPGVFFTSGTGSFTAHPNWILSIQAGSSSSTSLTFPLCMKCTREISQFYHVPPCADIRAHCGWKGK